MEPYVRDQPRLSRYAIFDGAEPGVEAGFAEYFLTEGEIAFIHTELTPRFAGRGLGSLLARGALDDACERGLRVLPYCPFIREWISRHPAYAGLVPEPHRTRFGLGDVRAGDPEAA